LAYIVDEVYKSLVQMCEMNGSDLSEVIRELASKQQLIDIRSAVREKRAEVAN
jgi:predicted CopG family antitoxin